MHGALIDLDGVVYRGDRAIAGASQTLGWLTESAIPHFFITNTSSKPRAALVEKLARLGIATQEERILTPAIAARQWLAVHAPGPAALFVPAASCADFTGIPRLDEGAESGAASVVVGDLGERWDFATLNRAFRLLMGEPAPRLVALGMTRYWRAADGLRLDVAPFIAALEHATGCRAVVLGKPSREFFQTALVALGCDAGSTLMVGDDIVGDVQGAQRAGIRGALVRTGKFTARDLDGEIRPDVVFDSIADLPAWWEARVPGPAGG